MDTKGFPVMLSTEEVNRLLEEHMALIWGIALKNFSRSAKLRREFEIEDLVHNLIVRLIHYLPRYEPDRAAITTYIYMLCRSYFARLYVEMKRDRRSYYSVEDVTLCSPEPAVGSELIAEETLESLLSILQGKYQWAVKQRAAGISWLEINNELGMAHGAIGQYMRTSSLLRDFRREHFHQ